MEPHALTRLIVQRGIHFETNGNIFTKDSRLGPPDRSERSATYIFQYAYIADEDAWIQYPYTREEVTCGSAGALYGGRSETTLYDGMPSFFNRRKMEIISGYDAKKRLEEVLRRMIERKEGRPSMVDEEIERRINELLKPENLTRTVAQMSFVTGGTILFPPAGPVLAHAMFGMEIAEVSLTVGKGLEIAGKARSEEELDEAARYLARALGSTLQSATQKGAMVGVKKAALWTLPAGFSTKNAMTPTPAEFLKPGKNTIYKSNGYFYRTNKDGNLTQAFGDLRLKRGVRNPYQQGKVGKSSGVPGDEGGHPIGTQFEGLGEGPLHLFPQAWKFNRGAGSKWKAMETDWRNYLSETPPKKVSVDIQLNWPRKGPQNRPESVDVTYWVTNPKTGVTKTYTQSFLNQ